MGMMNALGIQNNPSDMVKLFFVPTYLTGDDGIFNMPYYDLMTGNDLCVYPSYYEPWGYTPLEAAAFSVPCVTTDLAGFGIWANSMKAVRATAHLKRAWRLFIAPTPTLPIAPTA